LRPRTLLDVGCGSAAYGLLFRDLLERRRGRYHKKSWAGRMDAIEVWQEYITPVHEYVYDNIVIGDISGLVNKWPAKLLPHYDMIFMGDVLEHLDVPVGEAVLAKLRQLGTNVLISTPIVPEDQGPYNGNIYECHVSKWTPDMLERAGYRPIQIGHLLITALGTQGGSP
jgi:hypothetical protein